MDKVENEYAVGFQTSWVGANLVGVNLWLHNSENPNFFNSVTILAKWRG